MSDNNNSCGQYDAEFGSLDSNLNEITSQRVCSLPIIKNEGSIQQKDLLAAADSKINTQLNFCRPDRINELEEKLDLNLTIDDCQYIQKKHYLLNTNSRFKKLKCFSQNQYTKVIKAAKSFKDVRKNGEFALALIITGFVVLFIFIWSGLAMVSFFAYMNTEQRFMAAVLMIGLFVLFIEQVLAST